MGFCDAGDIAVAVQAQRHMTQGEIRMLKFINVA